MEEKGTPVFPLLIGVCAATIIAVFIAAGSLSYAGLWLFVLLLIMLFAIGSLVIRSMHPIVLSRQWGRDLLRSWEKSLLIPALILYPATAALAAADQVRGHWSTMPGWTIIFGFFFIASGYVLIIQALQADAPHAYEHYGEPAREEGEAGAYDILRYPIVLGAILIGLSFPFLLNSALAFIPVGLQILLLITYVAREDNWRFHEYEWFYEYTRKTPYRILPFIW